MSIEYEELSAEEYRRRASEMVARFEGFESRPYDARDGMATIGYGYTFNRGNNVELWERAGIQLTEVERRQLAAIDRAPANQRTAVGLAFPVQITREEARRLLETASLPEYEGPADDLNMPCSKERAALVSITYNRNPHLVRTRMDGFMDAVRDGDRAEAWYQLRYNSWGSNAEAELGLRKRRGMEAQIFGLYNDPGNVSMEEARDVYRMLQLHRDNILSSEQRWGTSVDGVVSRSDIIGRANRDYAADLIPNYGAVPTIKAALEPAKDRLLSGLRAEHPEISDRLAGDAFATTSILVDPGRELRTGNNLRTYQRNSSNHDVAQRYSATLDSRDVRNDVEIDANDLLIGMEGEDSLRSHRGDDLLIGGEGRDWTEGGIGRDTYVLGAGDTVKDSDGLGEVRLNGQLLTAGIRSTLESANTYRSADGRYVYTLENGDLMIVDSAATDQSLREGVVVKGFRNGDLGINLTDSSSQEHGALQSGRVELSPLGLARPGPFDDPHLDRAFSALLAGDGDELDRVSAEFTQSPEGQRMVQLGNELYEQQWLQEQQQLQEQQTQEQARRGPGLSR